MTSAEPVEVGIAEHFRSLRRHLLFGVVVFVLAATLVFLVVDQLVEIALRPVATRELLFLTVLGPLFFKLKLVMLIAALATAPVWVGLLVHFIAPALSRRQLLVVIGLLALSILLLGAAIAVTFYFVVPASLLALDHVAVPGVATYLTAESYLDFAILQTVVVAVVVQIPVLIHILLYAHLVDVRTLSRHRGSIYVVLCIALAFLTPTTDIFSLLAVFGVAVVFVELGLVTGSLIHTRSRKDRASAVQ